MQTFVIHELDNLNNVGVIQLSISNKSNLLNTIKEFLKSVLDCEQVLGLGDLEDIPLGTVTDWNAIYFYANIVLDGSICEREFVIIRSGVYSDHDTPKFD